CEWSLCPVEAVSKTKSDIALSKKELYLQTTSGADALCTGEAEHPAFHSRAHQSLCTSGHPPSESTWCAYQNLCVCGPEPNPEPHPECPAVPTARRSIRCVMTHLVHQTLSKVPTDYTMA
ncbi:mCG145261, isoform CRA_a, partial [Mus musculus]